MHSQLWSIFVAILAASCCYCCFVSLDFPFPLDTSLLGFLFACVARAVGPVRRELCADMWAHLLIRLLVCFYDEDLVA